MTEHNNNEPDPDEEEKEQKKTNIHKMDVRQKKMENKKKIKTKRLNGIEY